MGNEFTKLPEGREEVIILEKIKGHGRLCKGRVVSTFFKSGYPTQKLFRDKLSEHDWQRLDSEFVDVWNESKVSNISKACKIVSFFPGAYLLCVPLCWLGKLSEKRDAAMQEVLAKVNKYIFRPRGIFMKKRSVTESAGDTMVEMAWYEIALTPDEIKRLEARRCAWICPRPFANS